MPPSNSNHTLRLTEQLMETRDLSIFETKLIQVFILLRWKAAFWFFVLDYSLILLGILDLFLHVAFFRNPLVLIPLLLTQVWNLVIESIEVRNKKCGYFSDAWNYFDISRLVFGFTYFGVAMSAGYITSQLLRTLLLSVLCLVQSVKAFQMFSLFKTTRVLLRIVIEIIRDMMSFMVFVFVTTLVVSLLSLHCGHSRSLSHSCDLLRLPYAPRSTVLTSETSLWMSTLVSTLRSSLWLW